MNLEFRFAPTKLARIDLLGMMLKKTEIFSMTKIGSSLMLESSKLQYDLVILVRIQIQPVKYISPHK